MENIQLMLVFIWAFLVSLYAVPSIVELAWKKGLMDTFESRKIHNMLTPRLGGVAIFAGSFSSVLIFGDVDRFIQYLLASLLLVFFIGVRDDLYEISPFKKLIVQVVASFIVLYEGDLQITSLHGILSVQNIPEVISFTISILIILVITNAFNFIDGLDGLAGTLATISCLALGYYFIRTDYNLTIVALGLCGSLIGFLRYNLKKSTVFMGDSGSMYVGFLLSLLCLKEIEIAKTSSSFLFVYAILFVPLTDFGRVIVSRILRGVSPFRAARDHIHHILLDGGMAPGKILVILTSIALMVIALVMILEYSMELAPGYITFGLICMSIILSAFCEITFKKNPS